MRSEIFDRRTFLWGASLWGTSAVVVAGFGLLDTAPAQNKAPASWEEALKNIVGTAKPQEGKIKLDLPEIAENGNTVPFTVTVESPMTEQSYVKSIHIVSTGNPQPAVGTFHFTPQSGKAAVSGRMRLAKTQDVVGVAELSDGTFHIGRRTVKVTIGGCGG
ncbi:MAG: thiosulfate oxidation carrier protein SoxY [Hyphomicrobiaceae bacterium]